MAGSICDLCRTARPGPFPAQMREIHPTFSPDGESIVFWSDPTLKRIAVTGGVPVSVCETTPAPYGIDWSESGIVFVRPGAGIMRVSANGGTPEMVVPLTPRDGLAQGPQLLPDGETLLFTLAPARDIVVELLGKGAHRRAIDQDGRAQDAHRGGQRCAVSTDGASRVHGRGNADGGAVRPEQDAGHGGTRACCRRDTPVGTRRRLRGTICVLEVGCPRVCAGAASGRTG